MTYSSTSANIRTSVYAVQVTPSAPSAQFGAPGVPSAHLSMYSTSRRRRHYPAVLGVEALNEPWQFTPLDVVKAFYWEALGGARRRCGGSL